MSSSAAPQESIYQKVDLMSETGLDSLPRGAIQLNAQGTVLQYNAYEEKLAGLTKANVVGKNFFEQVAPCTDVQEFYGRFREGVAARQMASFIPIRILRTKFVYYLMQYAWYALCGLLIPGIWYLIVSSQ